MEERNKAMGHRQGNSSTYVAYYMPDYISADCQAIIFGSERQVDLMERMGRLHRHSDAPTKLTDAQIEEVEQDKQLVACKAECNALSQKLRSMGKQRYSDDAVAMNQDHKKLQLLVHTTRLRLKSQRLDAAIKEFHATVHTEEVARQLNGEEPKADATPELRYELPERHVVANIFTRANDIGSLDGIRDLRIELASAISQLCQRKETKNGPKRKGPPKRSAAEISEDKSYLPAHSCTIHQVPLPTVQQPRKPRKMGRPRKGEPPRSPYQRGNEAPRLKYPCAFCKWGDGEMGEVQRNNTYRNDALVKHWRAMHRPIITADTIHCPYADCDAAFGPAPFCQDWGRISFGNHVQRVHGVALQRGWNEAVLADSRVTLLRIHTIMDPMCI